MRRKKRVRLGGVGRWGKGAYRASGALRWQRSLNLGCRGEGVQWGKEVSRAPAAPPLHWRKRACPVGVGRSGIGAHKASEAWWQQRRGSTACQADADQLDQLAPLVGLGLPCSSLSLSFM